MLQPGEQFHRKDLMCDHRRMYNVNLQWTLALSWRLFLVTPKKCICWKRVLVSLINIPTWLQSIDDRSKCQFFHINSEKLMVSTKQSNVHHNWKIARMAQKTWDHSRRDRVWQTPGIASNCRLCRPILLACMNTTRAQLVLVLLTSMIFLAPSHSS